MEFLRRLFRASLPVQKTAPSAPIASPYTDGWDSVGGRSMIDPEHVDDPVTLVVDNHVSASGFKPEVTNKVAVVPLVEVLPGQAAIPEF